MSNISTFEVQRYFFLEHPERLAELANFYCNIWMYDPNFQEYKQCPNISCNRYYSYHEVEEKKIHTCHGTVDQPHIVEILRDAWNPEEVAMEIMDLFNKEEEFFIAISIDNFSDKIVGFTWGFVRSIEEIANSWGKKIAAQVPAHEGYVTYYSEIASDPNFRNQGIGSDLCRMLTNWMKNNYPTLPSLLRTHRNSPARRLFERVGYEIFADDTMYGGGRVMLKINKGSLLKPENL